MVSLGSLEAMGFLGHQDLLDHPDCQATKGSLHKPMLFQDHLAILVNLDLGDYRDIKV